jgi:hypothetical protein
MMRSVRLKGLTYGSEEEFRAAHALAGLCQGPTIVRLPPTKTYVNSVRSQTEDLRQSENIPEVRAGAWRRWKNRYDRARKCCD